MVPNGGAVYHRYMLAGAAAGHTPPKGVLRVLALAMLVTLTSSACVRGGFDKQVDGAIGHPDSGTDALQPAPLDGDCESGNGCIAPLVCTGLPGQRTCRPPCATSTECTGTNEVCGQPQDLAGNLYPRACIEVRVADLYESCGKSQSCTQPLACISMGAESFWAFCGLRCDMASCQPDEDCMTVLSDGGHLCLRRCGKDSDCPGNFHCTAIGGTDGHCLPTNPAGTDQSCDANKNVLCRAGHGCLNFGAGQPSACVPTCTNIDLCEGRRCIQDIAGTMDLCFLACDPLQPSACLPGQLCWPHAPTQLAYCIAASGSPLGAACGTTTATAPCDTGLTCVNNVCRQICTQAADCTAPEQCRELFNGGVKLPWKACAP